MEGKRNENGTKKKENGEGKKKILKDKNPKPKGRKEDPTKGGKEAFFTAFTNSLQALVIIGTAFSSGRLRA